jgi:hypothetical protein
VIIEEEDASGKGAVSYQLSAGKKEKPRSDAGRLHWLIAER